MCGIYRVTRIKLGKSIEHPVVNAAPQLITVQLGHQKHLAVMPNRASSLDDAELQHRFDLPTYLGTLRRGTRAADLAHEFLHACADWQVWLMATNQANVKE